MAVISELESKIIRQVEYYFGDHNLGRDKFLQEEIKKDEGWISLEVMLKFNRLAQLSKEEAVIADALAKSSSGLLEVHEDKSKIRRNPERKIPVVDSNWKDEVQSRTLYMKGFPVTASLDDIIPFVDKVCMSENVFMRRIKEKSQFKGSIFVTYKSVDDCNKILSSDCKKFKEDDAEDLIIQFQKDYLTAKNAELKEKRHGGKSKESAPKKEEIGVKEKAAVLKIVNADIQGLDVNAVKSAFSETAEKKVAWVTVNKEESTIKVRFNGENSAADVIKQLEGKITIEEKELELKLLEGEEETEYWEEFRRDHQNRRDAGRGGRGGRGGGRGGRGGRGGGGGGFHKRNDAKAEPKSEPMKVESAASETNGVEARSKRPSGAEADSDPAAKKVKTDDVEARSKRPSGAEAEAEPVAKKVKTEDVKSE